MAIENSNQIVERLRHIMTVRSLSQRALSSLLGIDPSNLSKSLSGKAPFTEGLVNRIVADLGISKQWLLTGEGVPYDKPCPAKEITIDGPLVPAPVPSGTPVYDLDVTAGCRPLEHLFGEVLPVGTINIPGIGPESHVVRVRGDSMMPRIINGGYVAIRPVRDPRNIFWGQIYVVQLEDFRLVKYVRRHPDPSMIILHSDNPAYDDMDVAREDVRALYIVDAIINCEVQ